MDKGLVDVLLILGGNPVFAAPADFEFGKRLMKVGFAHPPGHALCGRDVRPLPLERSRRPSLETWSDARAYDGTVTILQPLIAPLYEENRRTS